MMKPTADPHIYIEAQGDDWIRYYSSSNGRRWEVHGTCDRRGDCLIGATINNHEVTREDVERWRDTGHRPDSELDVPVTPEFTDCCPFTFKKF